MTRYHEFLQVLIENQQVNQTNWRFGSLRVSSTP